MVGMQIRRDYGEACFMLRRPPDASGPKNETKLVRFHSGLSLRKVPPFHSSETTITSGLHDRTALRSRHLEGA